MADKADDGIRQDIKKGRQDITDTRSALTEKLATLEERVQETVDGVKHTFDLHYQVKQRPWQMFGGSLLVGYMLGRRGGGSNAPEDTRESAARAEPQPGMVAELRHQFTSEIATLKGAAFGAVISTLWAMAKQTLLAPAQPEDSAIAKPGPRDSSQQISQRVDPSKTNGWHEQ